MSGTLFVVATPIGNLEDLSFRALRVLREVDLIAAEDTRRTSKLLARYEIQRPLISLREHNEARQTPRVLACLAADQSVALVSDAGTPGIADPGARLVRAVRHARHPVVPVPGPSAITAALSISGFPADQFVFAGFPPASGEARQRWFKQAAEEPRVLVFFEAPHRLKRTVRDLGLLLGERQILVCKELTKLHEMSVVYQNMASVTPGEERGEFVLVLGQPVYRPEKTAVADEEKLVRVFEALAAAGFGVQESEQMTAQAHGTDPKLIRKIIKKHNISVKQKNRWPS